MNERATIAAIVLLLAAGSLMTSLSPAAQSIAGSYEALLSTADGDVRCVLTLSPDANAGFRTASSSSGKEIASYSGAWLSDGGSVQVVLRNPADPSKPVAVTLEPKDGALVVMDVEGRKSPYVGLAFARSAADTHAFESNKQEKQ